MTEARVLIVDDEPAMLENCQRLLAPEGYACRTLADPTRAREVLAEARPDVLLLDMRMPGVDGMTVLAAALADDPILPVIIMTAFATVPSAVQAIREGAFDYIAKPFTGDQLVVAVARAVRYRGLKIENRQLREEMARTPGAEQIVGSSPEILRLLDQIRRVAPTDANVVITGESGTGKELVARSLHALSGRRTGPFVPVDSAALPEPLLESELFGHERGAFTGAVVRKNGLLAEADGGTVFLDEVAELSTGLQSKLLRVLEERKLRRVGGTALLDVNIRLIAATNAPLEAAVASGAFRADLYYRLNVVQLVVPPLRSRRGDTPLLAHTFLAQYARSLGREPPRISPEACDVLERHPWPGNVRELRNLCQRLVVFDEDGLVTMADLPEPLRGWNAPAAGEAGVPPYEDARTSAMTQFRTSYVRRLLAQHDGNVSRAARAAGLSRRTLHRWLEADGAPTGPQSSPSR
jgi:two-component system response regulator AtoC